ncbi:MAG: bifunctional DNA-formamidopyrimidine glycosylase/DNA-(apurinic or apyrimidinic site) lyase [Alphaproteobacteria bacterium]|nr:bifunctional DNA-formamidopyrimidine glycosylase/DNA-(apurinic or apyrimidinic site) lyase [Alphaproteobacteria bacterium]
MPELPEVETTKRGLEPVILNKTIKAVTVNRRDLRTPIPRTFEKTVSGQKITALRRRAKYILIDLANGKSILVHLGMSGSMRIVKPNKYKALKHDHVIFEMHDHAVVFHDPRRFGIIDVLTTATTEKHPLFAHLAPEPLSSDFNAAYLQEALARRNGPIKPVIMNQEVVVGVGNIYASESLFLAGIHPQTPAKHVVSRTPQLVKAIQKTLRAAIDSGGSTLRDFVHSDGATGYFQHRFNVYEREGEPCVACGREIIHMVQAGRASYFCATCQPNKNIAKKPRISKA